MEGNLEIDQTFPRLITERKRDREEWLSRVTGDVGAYTLVQGVKNVGDFVAKQATKHQNHVAQVLTEEWKIAPAPLEVAHFCDQVDDVKSSAARLEAKLNALLEKA